MDRFDPFVKYADVYGDIINWEKDPMNKPQNQNKYFFSDGKTYYEQICKMLRLMSVFKEAFNQIYSNEDEISEAWENFVNNLSASVVEGSEPDVTLTWTDDSVNFEFTMVPGVPGEQGVGITSISFNSDYTMTITLSDGNTYTSMSLKGETGPQGPQGETGSGLQILDVYATLADLQSAHPTGQPGDAYQVGSEGNYTLYIWSSSQSAWVQAGTLGTVSPYTSAPLMDGTASAGSQNLYARGDHVHPSDTSRASKAELDALIKTSQALIDQSFIYRESPAIQDGLARIDKIKGNTIVWNQLEENDVSTATQNGVTFTKNSDGSWTTSGTATTFTQKFFSSEPHNAVIGHKYLFIGGAQGGSNSTYSLRPYINGTGQGTSNRDYGNGVIITATTADKVYGSIAVAQGIDVTGLVWYPQIFDLTQMFGAGNEPTIEEFKSLFPLSYYNYNEGSLLSFNGTGLKSASEDESKEDTLALPVATYFSNGMRSAGTVYDELTPTKATTRIGLVDLGSLTWNKTSGTTPEYDYFETASSIATPGGTLNVLCPLYKTVNAMTSSSGKNKAVRITGTSSIRIRDLSYTDVSTFTSAMSGIYLCYELTTPTETAVDLDLDFICYEDGTEQLLPVNGSVPSTSPIIADMTYLSIDDAMEYIIDKLANVPENTQQILESLEDDVSDLQTDVGALQPAVSSLQTSVGNINTNIGQLSSTVAGHTSSISDMQSDITDLNTGLSNLEDTVTDNTSRIGTLESGLSTTNGNVQNLSTSVSDLDDTVTAQGATVTALDSIIQDISNNPVISSLGSHELGFVAAYVSATLPANTGTRVTIPKPTIFPNNYTPLFIVGMSTGSYNVSICEIPPTFGSSNSVNCRVWNHGSEQTTQITVYILCMRQRQSQ